MEPRSAIPRTLDPDASEFVRYCYRRRRVGWPELYDEMCAVAARGLFRGMSTDDLAGLGIGFSLFDMPALAVLANGIVAEEQAKRRPVAVTIRADEPHLDPIVAAPTPATPAVESPAIQEVAAVEEADVSAHIVEARSPERPAERGPEMPIRLVGVPAGV